MPDVSVWARAMNSIPAGSQAKYGQDFSVWSNAMESIQNNARLLSQSTYMRDLHELASSPSESARQDFALLNKHQTRFQNKLRSIFSDIADFQGNLGQIVSLIASKIDVVFTEIGNNSFELTETRITSGSQSVSLAEATTKIDEILSKNEVIKGLVHQQQTLIKALDQIGEVINKHNTPLRLVLLNILLHWVNHGSIPALDFCKNCVCIACGSLLPLRH